MLKKVFIAGLGITLLVGAIVYIKLGQFTAMGDAAKGMKFPPSTVTAVAISDSQWEQVIPATASVSVVQGVTLSAEVGGRITDIKFKSADTVEAGQVMLLMDATSEKSQLASAQAAAELARTELKRMRKLIKQKLASEDSVDRAEAQVKETLAQVGVIKALIQKKTVRAPFSGRLGFRQVDLGQILSEGEAIVALQMLDPVYVDFSIPQKKVSQLQSGMKLRVTSDASSDEVFQGEITAINFEVDKITRNVQVRALVNNPDEKLRVGMFVNVELLLPDTRQVRPIPMTAILYSPFGNSVFVIDEQKNEESGEVKKVLRQQFIKLGQARGDYVDVIDGLEDGEMIVTSGVFKLRTGTDVIIDNTLSPEFSLNPNPRDS